MPSLPAQQFRAACSVVDAAIRVLRACDDATIRDNRRALRQVLDALIGCQLQHRNAPLAARRFDLIRAGERALADSYDRLSRAA